MAELYFRVKVGLRDSDGAKVLERRLEDPRAYTYVPDLWDWFVRSHPEGQVLGPDASFLIARGAGWLGDADKFCAAMVAAQFLAVVPEGFRVKGWAKWAGFHLTVRAKDAARKRDLPGTSDGDPPEIQRNSTGASTGIPPERSLISDLSVSSKGGVGGEPPAGATATPLPRRPSPGKAEEWPLTASLLTILWERGWEAEWPRQRPSATQVEAAVRAVGATCAANRLMAMVERERAAGREPKPWLGWHLETIQPKPASLNGPQPVSQDFTKTLEDVERERKEALRGQR